MPNEIAPPPNVVQLHASGLCHFAKFKFLLDTGKSAFAQIGGDACRAASAEGVKHPFAPVGGSQDETCQEP